MGREAGSLQKSKSANLRIERMIRERAARKANKPKGESEDSDEEGDGDDFCDGGSVSLAGGGGSLSLGTLGGGAQRSFRQQLRRKQAKREAQGKAKKGGADGEAAADVNDEDKLRGEEDPEKTVESLAAETVDEDEANRLPPGVMHSAALVVSILLLGFNLVSCWG